MNLVDPEDLAKYFAPILQQIVRETVAQVMDELMKRLNGTQLQSQMTVVFPPKQP